MADKVLRNLVYGKGAHVDPVACVEDVSADLATRRVEAYPHSIWQIVEHMTYWMNYELEKIAGHEPCFPDKALESWPAEPVPASEERWQETERRFAGTLARLAELAKSDASVLGRAVTEVARPDQKQQSTVYALLAQIIAHNSYHAGQIALLRRQLGAWPPRRGGDTW
jgi:uncharacterized damage-inducible protein DinB